MTLIPSCNIPYIHTFIIISFHVDKPVMEDFFVIVLSTLMAHHSGEPRQW
jgi:hypothetical protein